MLQLQYFEHSDFEQLLKWVNSEELMINWAGSLFTYPLTQKSLEWYIENVNDLEKSDVFIYKATESTNGSTIGHISLGSISRKNRSGRITRVLVSDTGRGKGCCQVMVNALLKIGFDDLKLHRVSLGAYTINPSAINCYKKCGFVIEGITRDVLLFKNEWWSLVEMSILEDEWRAATK